MTLEAMYQRWLSCVFPHGVCPAQEEAMRAAFFSGATLGATAEQHEAVAFIKEVGAYAQQRLDESKEYEQN